MRKVLEVPKSRIQVLVHLYKDMEIETSLHYWSSTLNIPRDQFVKPYIKKSNRTDQDEKGYGFGTCNLRVSNTVMKGEILMTIKAIADYSKAYISKL